jgi:hypothetical protein
VRGASLVSMKNRSQSRPDAASDLSCYNKRL